MQIIHYILLYIIMNNPHITIPAPGPGEDTTFTLEVWQQHNMPTTLHLAEGWTGIEDQAFVDNPDLEEIHIPTSVVSIHEDAFNGAINLRQVEFAQSSMLNGPRLFFGDGVFAATEALKRINIPARATDIGDRAFLGATGLEQITFEEGSKIEVIGFQTFESATALQTIRIPARVKEISVEAFRNAISLTEVTFEEGSQLEFIGDDAFNGATALQTIHIPAGVGHIGEGAFRNTISLQTIRIPRLVQTLMNLTFENATSLREVTFEEGSQLEFIYDGVFRGATALQTIQIPASVLSIREDAFANTTNLRQVIFEPNSEIIHIDPNAFRDSGLELVVIGEIALERLNVERNTLNLTPLYFGPNNNFYGRDNVTIVSRAQQMYAFRGRRAPGYRQLPRDAKDYIAKFLMPPGAQPKSSAALAARAEDSAGGARKPRTRKRGIRRNSRKASRAQKTKKRKSKRRRTMKRK